MCAEARARKRLPRARSLTKKGAPARALRFRHDDAYVLGRGGALAALRHEGVELVAVLCPLQLLDELGERGRLLVEAAALFLEPLELAPAVFLEGEVAGRRELGPGAGRAVAGPVPRPAAGAAEPAEVLLEEGLRLVRHRIAGAFPDQVGKRHRPDEDEAEDDAGDLEPARRAAAALAGGPAGIGAGAAGVMAGIPAGGGGMARHRGLRM